MMTPAELQLGHDALHLTSGALRVLGGHSAKPDKTGGIGLDDFGQFVVGALGHVAAELRGEGLYPRRSDAEQVHVHAEAVHLSQAKVHVGQPLYQRTLVVHLQVARLGGVQRLGELQVLFEVLAGREGLLGGDQAHAGSVSCRRAGPLTPSAPEAPPDTPHGSARMRWCD